MTEGGPAERAGLQGPRYNDERIAPGIIRRTIDHDSADLIVAIDNKRIRTADELLTEVEKHQPGDVIKVGVVRDRKPMNISVRLGES
jgi:S1-C subfamily serine protease